MNQGSGAIALAIRRPVGVLVGVLLVLLFGGMALVGLPVQLTPDIEIPTVSITTRWPGAAPVEVEREILEPQEQVLKSLSGLERMTSEASDSSGSLTLELEVGTSLEEALVRVTNALAQVPSYPASAREPVVNTAGSTGPPLAVILVQGQHGQPVGAWRTSVEQDVVPQLERVPGVGGVRLFGGRDTEVEVRFDPEALAARGVGIGELANAVRAELRDVSGGDLDLGKRRYIVRTDVAPEAVGDLEDVVLRVAGDGTPVRVGDVAEVALGLRKYSARVFGDDHESLAILLDREAGSNVLTTTREVRAVVDELQARYFAPRDLEIRVVSDQVDYIQGALSLVRQNLVIGGGLAAIVLLVFLRSIPASAVVAAAIPICVIGTSLGMASLGRTINVVSLAGMAFAVGLVVDNAIVVLENIETWRSRGKSPAEAALEGTREVWGAILASTLTTVAVFVPILTWKDEVGELLRDVAAAISVAVLLSLVVSVLVIPSFSAKLLRPRPPATLGAISRAGERFRDAIGAGAGWIARGGFRASVIAVGIVTLTAGTAALLLPPMEYLPTGNRNLLFGVMLAPDGYSVAEMTRVGEHVQSKMAAHTGRDVDGVPAIERSFFVARPGGAFMGASTVEDHRIGELVDFVRGVQRSIPGVFGVASQASLFGRNIGSSRAIDVDLIGADLEQMTAVGGMLMGALSGALPEAQIRPNPSLDLGAPELRIAPKRQQATALGLTGADLGLVVDALVDGAIVGELGPQGMPQVDVVLRPRGGGVRDVDSLEAAPVATPSGQVVPLSTVAQVRETVGPATIRRLERRRAITLTVSPPDDVALEDAMAIVDGVIARLRDEGRLPADLGVELTGTADDLTQAQGRFGRTLLLAVVISFLLMAALFEDFLAPLVILVTVPLAAAGGVLGLRVVDFALGPQPFDMMTAVGFVILMGVVVNNAILVVDGTLSRLREGAALDRALDRAVAGRVRPIFMSTLTSLAGLLPLVLFPGSGSELYRGVGAIVLGGLALSTVLTLVAVPAVFSVTWKLARRA